MKTYQKIEEEIVKDIVAQTDKVTYFGVGGVLRGFITAVSLKIRDLWFEITQLKRKLFIDTASGTDLDILGAERGLTRKAPTKAGALCVFNGPDNTVIPSDTVVKNPTSNIQYKTKETITLGTQNPDFVESGAMNINNIGIGDVVWVECVQAGTIGRSPANSITSISIPNVTVKNPAPAQGGSDVESDDAFRYRIKNYIKLLNKNTQAYYETLCQDLDTRILRTKAIKNYYVPDGVNIIIVPKSGVPFSNGDLTTLANSIIDSQRSFTNIICSNIAFTLVSVEMRVKLKPVGINPVNFSKYYIDMADALAKFFDWSKWEWGKAISLDDVLDVCQSVPQTDDIELPTFKLNGSSATSILLDPNSLPYFQSVIITDITQEPYVTKGNESITQSYQQQQIINEE